MYAMRWLAAWTAAGARIGMAVLGGVAGWNLPHCPAQGVLSAGKTALGYLSPADYEQTLTPTTLHQVAA